MRAELKDQQPRLPGEGINRCGIIAGCSAAATKPAGSRGKRGEGPLCKDIMAKDGDVCADLASVKERPISISELCLLQYPTTMDVI